MSHFLRSRVLSAAVAALGALLLAARPMAAQDGPVPMLPGPGSNEPPLDVSKMSSPFRLSALGDMAQVGIGGAGPVSMCVSNNAFGGPYNRDGCLSPFYVRGPNGAYYQAYFDLGILLAAPPSDMPSVIDPVASGLRGGGWTFSTTSLVAQFTGGTDKIWASDRSGLELLAFGVQSTSDASCTNRDATRDGNMAPGFQILPLSSCPPTHPPSGWRGSHHAEAEVYLDLFQNDPVFRDGDPFAFWRVPRERQRTDKFMGDLQTYGEMSDFYFELLPKYGAVVPGGSGAPVPPYDGWPLGITIWFDVFYFGLPNIGGAVFWQGLIINDSEKVYGVGNGVDFDSLYIGINYNPLMGAQSSAQYFDPKRSALLHNTTGSGCVGHPVPPGSACAQNAQEGFFSGAAGIIVLKSPIGDLRYKLLSDPSSEFYSPGHPLAGDTITFQHQHMCGFGSCYPQTTGRSLRAGFGLYSSTGINVLDGRSPGDLTDTEYFRIFRSEFWPERTGQFNKYVPGVHDNEPIWDWNHDGVPDTIYADSCGSKGCVALWSDTLPGGWAMNYGNISAMAVGPVKLAPNDTVPLVVAFVGAPDSAGIEAITNNAIQFYLNFYLGPEAAPQPRIVAVDAVPGNTRQAVVTLFLDNTAEDWEDPFLAKLDVSADAALNPDLPDQIAALVGNNVAAYHIFRSCDNGNSYSSDADCDGDPISDPTSKWAGFGWAPYATLEATEDGELPNTFRDENVTAGITYTYVVVTETRGAKFNLVRQGPNGLVAEEVEFAPKLMSSLSAATTNPFVASVYVPATLAAGTSRASVEMLERTGTATVPVTITPVGTAPRGGTFRAIIVDSVVVRQVESISTGQVQSTLDAFLLRTDTTGARVAIRTYQFSRTGDITTSGLAADAPATDGDQTVQVWRGGRAMLVLDGANQPLLATATLTGDAATPGSFYSRPDFPYFSVSLNAASGGTFGGQVFIAANGELIDPRVAPSVQFQTSSNLSAALNGSDYGTYEIVWADEPFGDGQPFRVNDRANIASLVQASLNARATASTSSADPALLDVVKAADASVTLDAASLRSYKLPFKVRNLVYNRDVQVIVTRHQESIVLGQGADTIRVDVPADVWVPGDVVHFVENITREVRDAQGRTVIGPDGQPVTETVPVATTRAMLGCLAPRNSCDPTIGGRSQSGYTGIRDNTKHLVTYYVPFRGGEELRFELVPARTAADVLASGGRVDLSQVHVVPNPYIFASQYERDPGARVLKFTNLPPEGRIRIFDVAGRFIQEINYDADDLKGGDLEWDMQTREQLELAYGLYIFVVESGGQKKMGKFVVIR